MKTFELLQKKKEQIYAIAARHGAINVRVFGSVARGEDSEESDIDLLVTMKPDRSLYDLIGLQQDIEKLMGRKTDVVTEKSLNRYLKENIEHEAVAL